MRWDKWALVWDSKETEASTPRHEGRPPTSNLSIANGGRGLHPAASPPAYCMPTAARREWI